MNPEYETVWHGATWRQGRVEPRSSTPETFRPGQTTAIARQAEQDITRALDGRYLTCAQLEDLLVVYSKKCIYNSLKRLQKRRRIIARFVSLEYRGSTTRAFVFGLANRPFAYQPPARKPKRCVSCGGTPLPKTRLCQPCRKEYDRNRRAKREAA